MPHAMPDRPGPRRAGRRRAQRIVTAAVGGALTVLGVVMLVLPGPGVVVVAAGLAVLAREFEWAARPLRLARRKASEGIDAVARRPALAALDALAAVGLVAVAVVDLVVGLPVLEVVSDVALILSGAFLAGTVVYARAGVAARA